MNEAELFQIESRLLLEAVRLGYGYDFSEYAEASLRRRLAQWFARSGFASLAEAQAGLLRSPGVMDDVLQGLTVNVTEMFRDPSFFAAFRETVVPHLKTWPFLRLWLAGCASGEEAYSLAILLEEEGLSGRYRLYATDISNQALERARQGIYPLRDMQRYTRNYQAGGGKRSFADYYTARYDHAMITPRLAEAIVFAAHNLVTDAAFGEMHLVLCRNVLIYFKPLLKDRVLALFDSCLPAGGFLCLGLKEGLAGRAIAPAFQEHAGPERIYRKRYRATAPPDGR